MGILSNTPTMKAPSQSSAKQNTAVGSGSRPTKSRHNIPTSAPMDPLTLGRSTPDDLHSRAPATKPGWMSK